MKKINRRFVEHGWVLPNQRLQIFKDSLEKILTDCHDRHPPSEELKQLNTLRNKIDETKTIIRKTDKSKVFHLGKLDDYKEKARAYMNQTQAYQDLGTSNPLESLVNKTNDFLYGLWRNKHITQKQYERLKVEKEQTEIAHLYFLPKAHKPKTPLRPIMAGLKSPTIAISRWLDGLLRPLFNRLANETTILNGSQLVKQIEQWSAKYLTSTTSFITMDVTDLYTMIPQEGGIKAIRKLMETSNIKQIDGVKKEIILALARFVMTNNYFYLDGLYYKQIRGGAMGSPLTLTIANAYMYFVERPISKWAIRTNSLYYRYIDDLFIMSNVDVDTLKGLVNHWNKLDININLSASIGHTAEYLDLKIENRGGSLISEVFHKASHEPYFLPFTSVHAKHIKKNIPYAALVRAIRYSSSFDAFKREEAHIIVSLLLNKYPKDFILDQLKRVPQSFRCVVPTRRNYSDIRKTFLENSSKESKKARIDFEATIFCHFSFCKGMKDFSTLFHKLWDDCFSDTAITNITPIVGSKRLHNLHDYLVKKKPDRLMLTVQKQCPTTTPTTTDISNGNDHKILNNPSGEIVPVGTTSWHH
ncbi:unnamed protein product [Rotaria socialis]|uniref:Reverse transcriptase domain-containing protein n=4 Tax=Rotaria socialis TaxID=392032 RepID=A0A817YYF7_9BILA|nr:unnamed protein product [Rotaria socialis]CAF4656510.1 unnamed protein product [Rotaria socialis]